MLDYVGILRRRWLTVLAVIVVIASATALVMSFQTPLYQASSEVLLSRSDLGASLTGITASPSAPDSDRFAETQAILARTDEIARRALAAAGVRDRTPAELLAQSEVAPVQNADLLQFRVSDPSPELAARLATAYARAYKGYRLELELSALRRALAEVRRKLAGQRPGSRLYAVLEQKELELATSAALPTASTLLVHPADSAPQVRPRWKRNLVFAAIFGVFSGVALAFIIEALDRRVRRVEEIGDRLKLPLLGRVPPPPRSVRKDGGLVASRDAFGRHAEVFRTLALNLEMVNRNGAKPEAQRIIMATSAVENEGKTTTLANLAIAFAETGRNVILVDLDLRHPSLDRLLNVPALPGLTEVVGGHARMDDVLRRVPFAVDADSNPKTSLDGHPRGGLRVLPRGSPTLNPTEFLGSPELGAVFTRLADDADYVLIDTPPLLRVGDGVALFTNVDAMFVVTRLGVVKRPMLNELERILERSHVTRLGYVVTGIRVTDLYGPPEYEYGRPR